MNPGRLRHLISIQQELTTQNTYGESTQAWVDFLTGVYASVEPIRGREFFSAQQFNADVTHRIRMRYHPGIHPKMRIKYCYRYFDINAVIDVDERHKEMQLMCTEVI